MTLEDLRARVDAGAINEVILALPDLTGRLQGTRLSARHFLDSTVTDGFGACTYLLTSNIDMAVTAPSSELDPEGTGYGDMVLAPDLATVRPIPWDPGTVMVVVDAQHPDGRAVRVAPRHALQTQIDALAGHGLVPLAGVELEFRVFTESYSAAHAVGWSHLTPASRTGVDYALVGLEQMDALTRRLRLETVAAGLHLESARGECAPGQYEIVFRYDGALAAADAAAFYKTAAKQIAAQEGMALTFMPKYDTAEGNSCHLHVSLRDQDGVPVLAGDGKYGESLLMRQMLAGQLAYLAEFTLLFAPTVNAYKRLRPGAFAPTSVAWGRDNRLAALRLIGSGHSLRLENRVPGGDADPYLALAAVLLAARHGIENELPLPDPVQGIPEPDAPALPSSLLEAADLFDESRIAREGLGDALVDALVAAARAEWAEYAETVSDWERARGFERR